MKVMFIVPPEIFPIESYASDRIIKTREPRPRLGILCVAGYLRDKIGIAPIIVDCAAEGIDIKDIKGIIDKYNPDIIGMSVLTFNLLDCLEIAKTAKQANQNIKICFGGFHPTIYPEETLSFECVDFIVVGEGEKPFAQLIDRLIKDKNCNDLKEISGIGWKNTTGKINLNAPCEVTHDLDDFGLPAHDLIDLSKYSHALSNEPYTAYIQTSRGCPFKCNFCDMRMTNFRSRSEEMVIREIRLLVEKAVKEIFFLDDTITVNKKKLIALCQRIIDKGFRIKYKISSRVNTVNEEMLVALKRSGCYRIHYGVESGSQRILDGLQKGITIDQIKRAFEMTKRNGISTYAYLMVGAPTETREDFESTVALVNTIQPDYITYSICTPFPKTLLYNYLLEKGYYKSDYWLEFAKKPSPDFKLQYANEYFSAMELKKMRDDAMAKFYGKGSFMFRELMQTRSIKQLVKKAKVGYRLLLK